ncbi:uncharacterized protein [Blastocystis hominis]|uniref:DIX domain-containing protein n=1 Tax=Blastocystis hominis TaxID=12968 RepID=D8M8I1_BLAHO|nr:uncharacterized protein [Blastocystis hominis]CBK24370.2 unnamed protein product [Blastocystis hominis]|eukprot:XP_012898418.1 uncharacterized protein [Blastocystis hominis]
MSKKTSVLYYIPEDGDEADHPNVMTLDKNASQVTLKDIREAFPIPGTYYFRFKRTFKNSWIWFDVTEDSEVVPKFDGLIFVKATRLPASAAPKKSKPSVKKPASRPKPTKPAKQEPKKELEEDFLHNIEMPSSTPEFVEPQQPEIDFFSPASNTSNTPVNNDVFGEYDFPTAKPVDPWDAIKI